MKSGVDTFTFKKLTEHLYRVIEKPGLLFLRKFGEVARFLALNPGTETGVVRYVEPCIGQYRRGYLSAACEHIQQHPVQAVSSADRDPGPLLQLLETDAPVPVLCGLRTLPDDEVRRPLQSGVEDIPHPRQIGGEAWVIIAVGIDQHTVLAALAQRQQAVDGSVVDEHPAFVLRNERLICERCDHQRGKLRR